MKSNYNNTRVIRGKHCCERTMVTDICTFSLELHVAKQMTSTTTVLLSLAPLMLHLKVLNWLLCLHNEGCGSLLDYECVWLSESNLYNTER